MALGNTPRQETNIFVEASKSFVLGLHFVMDDGSATVEPVDLTDCVLRMVVAESAYRGGSEVLNLEAEFDPPTAGLAMFKFQAEDLSLTPAQYAYDITLIPPSGFSTPVLKGYIEVGANTDFDTANVYDNLNLTSDITVLLAGKDVVEITLERVDGMYLVVSALIEDFEVQMAAQVAEATKQATAAKAAEGGAYAYAEQMRVWLDNAGYPFWKGTQAEYDALGSVKPHVLYLITDSVYS